MNRRKCIGWLIILCGFSGCATVRSPIFERDTLTPAEHQSLGDAYLLQNETALAVQQYQAALAEDSHFVPALVALGNGAFEDRDWGKASAYFRRALKRDPVNPGVMNNLAMVYLAEKKHLDRAEVLVDRALPVAGPLAPYLYDTRAQIALQQGRYSDARQALEQAAAAAPPNNPDFTRHLQESRQKLAQALSLK